MEVDGGAGGVDDVADEGSGAANEHDHDVVQIDDAEDCEIMSAVLSKVMREVDQVTNKHQFATNVGSLGKTVERWVDPLGLHFTKTLVATNVGSILAPSILPLALLP